MTCSSPSTRRALILHSKRKLCLIAMLLILIWYITNKHSHILWSPLLLKYSCCPGKTPQFPFKSENAITHRSPSSIVVLWMEMWLRLCHPSENVILGKPRSPLHTMRWKWTLRPIGEQSTHVVHESLPNFLLKAKIQYHISHPSEKQRTHVINGSSRISYQKRRSNSQASPVSF